MRSNFTLKSFLFALILLVGSHAFAQESMDRERGRGVYVELFGNGLFYSVNYDQRFDRRLDGLGYKVGFSYLAVDGVAVATVPFGLNYLLGKDGKYFEMVLGGTYLAGVDRTNTFASSDERNFGDGMIGTMTFGYRREPTDGGFLFRASMTPVFGSGTFWPLFFGVSFGYAF